MFSPTVLTSDPPFALVHPMIRGQTVITEVIAPCKLYMVIITLALIFWAILRLVIFLAHDTIFVLGISHSGVAIAFSLVVISHSGGKVIVLELWVVVLFLFLFLIFGATQDVSKHRMRSGTSLLFNKPNDVIELDFSILISC